jgi:hypothetical protein
MGRGQDPGQRHGGPPLPERGEWVVHTEPLSSFARLADAATFGRLALVETHRRGTETAKTVGAVRDGAEWIPGFVDLQRPDAVRILDFSHALSDVAQAGQAVYGEGTTAFTRWVARQRQTLHHGSPGEGLEARRPLAAAATRRGKPHAVTTGQESLGYLAKRRDMLASAWCDARGYPIGSGSVESANKRVVERRLKGAGMHWARRHVKPLVALRALACSDRWQEASPHMAQHGRHQTQQDRQPRQRVRRQAKAPMPLATRQPEPPIALATAAPETPRPTPRRAPSSTPTVHKAAKGPYRPPPDHPWRRFRIRWRGAQQTTIAAFAKR